MGAWQRGDGKVIWMHCASLGEFEQGRPVLEALHSQYPEVKLVLSFFSPSGFEMRKNFPLAAGVFYLPADSPANARDFLDLLRPDAVIFVKYEFWYYILRETHARKIPAYLISAIFRPDQIFFKPWGSLFREMLSFFDVLFVQNETSCLLIESIGLSSAVVSGDTRIDRVLALSRERKEWPLIEAFSRDSRLLIAGSTWAPDEQILIQWLGHPSSEGWKCMIAPHEIREGHIQSLMRKLDEPVVRFTEGDPALASGARIMILDTIGVLGQTYRQATAAFIGGGFGKGIHNILEPMASGAPVLFGPRHQKFREAELLIEAGAAWSVTDAAAFIERMEALSDDTFRKEASVKGLAVLNKNRGATEKIVQKIGTILKNPQLR